MAASTSSAGSSSDLLNPALIELAHGIDDHTIELRREIHADPELGLHLPRTQQRILESLTGLGLNITTGESTTSVVADLDSGRPGPTVLLRADMDALPLQEDNDISFRSRNDGMMHACGHDAHVAMLASAAKILSDHRGEFQGRVRFMFQPGEEGFHGARYMIEEGVLDGVDRAFAIHVVSNLPNGAVFSKSGALMASADSFQITVNGRGGHASTPHATADPIPAAAAIVLGLHTMVGRSTDATNAGVLTVAHLQAGTTNNVIPAAAFMEGTIRAHDEGTRSILHAGVGRVAEHTAAAHGCSCTYEVVPGYPVTSNDPEQVQRALDVAREILGESLVHEMPRAAMGAEDWSYVLQQVPGSMVFLGVAPDDTNPFGAAPNHSNLMEISESKLAHGVGLYAAMALAG